MAEQPALDMFGLQGLPQKGIRLQIDHAQGQVVARAPIAVDPGQFIGRERRFRDRPTVLFLRR